MRPTVTSRRRRRLVEFLVSFKFNKIIFIEHHYLKIGYHNLLFDARQQNCCCVCGWNVLGLYDRD